MLEADMVEPEKDRTKLSDFDVACDTPMCSGIMECMDRKTVQRRNPEGKCNVTIRYEFQCSTCSTCKVY